MQCNGMYTRGRWPRMPKEPPVQTIAMLTGVALAKVLSPDSSSYAGSKTNFIQHLRVLVSVQCDERLAPDGCLAAPDITKVIATTRRSLSNLHQARRPRTCTILRDERSKQTVAPVCVRYAPFDNLEGRLVLRMRLLLKNLVCHVLKLLL